MTIISEERQSDSPYVESITRGQTLSAGSTIRPAEIHWHLVLRKLSSGIHLLVVGPWTTAGVASWGKDAELLWIKLRLGTFMPHLAPRSLLDSETVLPGASSSSFWLRGSAWQFPDFENADTFVNRQVRDEILARDPLIGAVLEDGAPRVASRTVRHRFLRATGLTQGHIRQMKRAQQALALLQDGASILDAADQAGYFDQPHLTRSLKRLIGYTPAEIVRMSRPDCHSVQDSEPIPGYHAARLNIAQ